MSDLTQNSTPGLAGRIAATFARNPRLILLVIGLALVAGLAALQAIPRKEDPTLTGRFAVIQTSYPGASPQRVEALVADVLEDELREIEEIAEIVSTSRTGFSTISIELDDSIMDVEPIWSQVRDALGDARPNLPIEAEDPEFERSNPEAVTFLVGLVPVSDAMGQASEALVVRLAEDLEERLSRLLGTKETDKYGAAEEEITVRYDPAVLASYGLTPEQLAETIAQGDSKSPAGTLHARDREIALEVAGALQGVADIAEIPLRRLEDGSILRVGMIADVSKGIRDPRPVLALTDGRAAVFVSATMADTRRVDLWAMEARDVVAEFSGELPPGLEARILFDQSSFTNARLSDLMMNLAIGVMLVMLVLFVMMGLRSALLVGLALPLTMTIVLFALHTLSVPLHQMSVTGLIIALGLLIDNAIVAVDEYDRRRARGYSQIDAVTKLANHLAVPLLASTATTVLAFLPIYLMPGPGGEFVGTIALSVILCVTTSLALALTIIPAVSSIVDRRAGTRISDDETSEEIDHAVPRPGLRIPPLSRGFRSLLTVLHGRPALGIAVAIALPVLGFALAPTLPGQFFPPTDRNQFQVQLRLPGEASLDATRAAVEEVRAVFATFPEITRDHWVMGEGPPRVYYNTILLADSDPAFAGAFVETQSPEATRAILPDLQLALMERLPDAEVLAIPFEQGPPFDAPVEIELYGPDLTVLAALGDQIRRVLTETDGVTYSRTTMGSGRPKLVFDVDEDKATAAGFTLDQIAAALRGRQEGLTGGSILEGTEELPVRVRAADLERGDLEALAAAPLALPMATLSGTTAQQEVRTVPLNSLGQVRLTGTVDAIHRFFGERRNTVQAFIVPYTLPSLVLSDFSRRLEAEGITLPDGYRMEIGGESAESAEAQGRLLATFLPLLVLMIGSMVLAFNSFRQAGLIMTVGGLSMGLSFLAIWVFGYPMGFMSIIGGMGLLGIAINDSIVILSALREDPEASKGELHAVTEKVMEGSRHVFSTTLTTIGGFLPLLLFGGNFWGPLASAIAGGLLGATLLALVFVPSCHRLLTRRKRRRATDQRDSGEPSLEVATEASSDPVPHTIQPRSARSAGAMAMKPLAAE